MTAYDSRNLETFVRSCSNRSKCVDTKGQMWDLSQCHLEISIIKNNLEVQNEKNMKKNCEPNIAGPFQKSSEAACNEVELVDGLGMQVMLVNSSRPQKLASGIANCHWHTYAHVSAEGCEMIVTGPKIVLPIFDVLAAKNLLGTAQKTGSATSCHSLLGPPALLCNHECGLTKRHQYNCDFIGFSLFFHLFCVYLALFHLSFTSESLAILNWHDKKLNHFGGEVAKVH